MNMRKDPKQAAFIREKGQDILKQAATALAFMNAKGWIHRDVKPDNLLVNSAGEVRLIDFALSQRPVTGRPPFRGSSSQDLLHKHISEKPVTPKMYNPDVTDQFADLVLRMLAKKREDRPRDFHAVLMALRGLRVFKPEAPGKTG